MADVDYAFIPKAQILASHAHANLDKDWGPFQSKDAALQSMPNTAVRKAGKKFGVVSTVGGVTTVEEYMFTKDNATDNDIVKLVLSSDDVTGTFDYTIGSTTSEQLSEAIGANKIITIGTYIASVGIVGSSSDAYYVVCYTDKDGVFHQINHGPSLSSVGTETTKEFAEVTTASSPSELGFGGVIGGLKKYQGNVVLDMGSASDSGTLASTIKNLVSYGVHIDADDTNNVFAIKNINNETIGSITLGTNATNGAAELTFVAGSDSFVASLPNLAYDSSNQMLKMVKADGTQTNLIKLSNLQIKGVGSTLPCWDTTATPDPVSREAKGATGAPHWAIGDLFLLENSSTTPSTFDLCVCTNVVDDGTYYNYSWENIGSINNVSLVADQVIYDDTETQIGETDVQSAIEKTYELASSAIEDAIDTTNILDPNLINKSVHKYIAISTGYALDDSNNLYYVTDYIPFTSNGMYINGWAGYGTMGWALYDSNKSHIPGAGGKTNIVEYQEGAAYIRITLKASEESTWMLSEGITPKDYVAYHAHITSIKENVSVPQVNNVEENVSLNNDKLSAAFDFQRDNTNILAPELIDESSHKYININDGKAKSTTGNVYVTDFIPITNDGAYISGLAEGGVFGWALYDGDKVFISGASGKTSSIPYTEGAVFLRATLSIANRNKWMICNGTTPRSYVPYNYLRPTPKFNMPNDLLATTFGNRQFVILGDSSVTSDKWTGLFATFVGDYSSVVYNAAVGSKSWQHLQDQWDSVKANVTVDDPIIIIGAGPVGLENYIDAGSHTNQYGVYIDYSQNKTVVNWTTDKVLQRCIADTSAKATNLDAGIEFMKDLLKEKPKAMIFLQNNWITMHDFMTTQNYDVIDYIARRRKLKEFYEVFADFFGCAIVDASRANIHGYIENYTLDNGATYPYRWATGDGTHINQAEGKERVFNMWVGTLIQYLMKV